MSVFHRIIFQCDGCGDEEDTGLTDFHDALDHIRSAGWVTRKDGDEWLHFCSRECANDNR